LTTLAKGLTSPYVPLSACIVGQRVYDVMEQGAATVGSFSHGYTYSGHTLAVAAANAVLDIVEREDIPGQAKKTGAHLQAALHKAFAGLPLVGEVRGVGMMAAVEFVADPKTKKRLDPALKVAA